MIDLMLSVDRRPTMAKKEQTSRKVGSTASKLLKSPKSTKPVKSVSGSALTQRPSKKK